MKLFLALALALVFSVAEVGDDPEVRFQRLSVNEGLSQSQVSTVLQDSDGYMWIGTFDGLNRYDGYSFTVFKHDPEDPNSLSHNHVTAVYEDRSGMLWIGTREGLNRYDRLTGRFDRYAHDAEVPTSLSSNHVTAVYEERSGVLWVCTLNGLNRMNRDRGTFERFKYDPGDPRSISSNAVRTIVEDRSGNLWVGTNFGLNRFDRDTESFDRLGSIGEDGDQVKVVMSIYESAGESGQLWVGTWGGGVFLFDTQDGAYATFNSESIGLPDDRVTTVYEDSRGEVWVGTATGGLSRLDRESGSTTTYRHDPRENESLSSDRVQNIIEDDHGGLWVATMSGVNRADRMGHTFAHIRKDPDIPLSLTDNMVWSIASDTSGAVWIGTLTAGLNRYQRSTGEIKHFRHDPKDRGSLGSDGPLSVYVDRHGTLWVGTLAGLDRFNRSTGSFDHFELTEKRSGQFENAVVVMLEDHRGRFWVGSPSGLFKFDRRKEEFQRVGKIEVVGGKDDPKRKGNEPQAVSTLFEDTQKNLWIGSTVSGLYRLSPDRESLAHFSNDPSDSKTLSHNTVLSVYELQSLPGVIWVGTYSGGLNRLDLESGTFEHYTEQNSDLPTNTVVGILGDDDGHLWLSTHNGLVRFDPPTEQFRVFDLDRGIQSREFNFGAVHRSATGELFFGGINGLNTFHPDEVKDNPHPPNVVLTDFKLFNTSVDIGEGSVLTEFISGTDRVELKHDQNDVSFEYVGLHFTAPSKNSYAYMLENYDQDWRFVGDRRSAIYTSLDPGEYVFRVKAASSDGVWNQTGASVSILVRPPWWKTGWAWILYGFAIALVAFAIDRVQRKRLIARERARAEIREVRLKAQAAEAQAMVLQAENERQTRELEEARDLQLSMLPDRLPHHPQLEIAAEMRTATEVGGDYYDFVVDERGRLTLVIGDATGHGANAGTMVTATKSLFNVLADEDDIMEMLRKSNEALKSMSLRKLYMALAFAKYNDYLLELVGAGMPPALVYRAATGAVEEIVLKGIPLGTFATYPYRKYTIAVQPGDTVVLMTDGFPELFNGDGEMLGYRRVKEVFAEVADRSPADILDHFLDVGSLWTNGQGRGDDMTFIVLKARTVV